MSLHGMYFFDFPLCDVYSIGCAALNLMYYGTRRGVFGSGTKDAINLKDTKAVQVTLNPRTETLLSESYDYYLIFYCKKLAQDLWDAGHRREHPKLKGLTLRVEFSKKPSLDPHRLKPFYIKSHRPIYVALYSCGIPNDHCVPTSYEDEFNELFQGYMVRTPKNYSLESELFGIQDLRLHERRDGTVISPTTPHVVVYH